MVKKEDLINEAMKSVNWEVISKFQEFIEKHPLLIKILSIALIMLIYYIFWIR